MQKLKLRSTPPEEKQQNNQPTREPHIRNNQMPNSHIHFQWQKLLYLFPDAS